MTGPRRFAVRSRILHWITAIGVFSALLIGFAMVNSVGSYAALVAVHMSIGITILAITVVRLINRRITHPPAWPSTVGHLEGKIVTYSERLMYGLLLVQPLVGWAMVSAAGRPAIFFGLHLPTIAPFNASVYFVLRQSHSVLAYLLVVVIAAHVCAVLLHTLTLRDRMFSRMWFGQSRHEPVTTSEGPS